MQDLIFQYFDEARESFREAPEWSWKGVLLAIGTCVMVVLTVAAIMLTIAGIM